MTDKNTRGISTKIMEFTRNLVRNWIVKNASIIKQGNLYALASQSNTATPKAILIVGTEHCTVLERDYPILKHSAVKKISAREFKSEWPQQISIGPLVNGKRKVTVVRYKVPGQEAALARATFIFPEHIVATKSLSAKNQEGLEYEFNSQVYWFAHSNGQPVGAQQVGLLRSRVNFELSVGYSESMQWLQFDFKKYLVLLADNLCGFIPRDVINYLQPQKDTSQYKNAVPMLAIGASIFAVYFAIVTLWLTVTNEDLKEQALRLSAESAEVFDLVSELQRVQNEFNQFKELASGSSLDVRAWLALAPVINSAAKINRISYFNGDQYLVEGEAKNATQVLSVLREHRLTADAAFNSPTVDTQGVQRFSIVLQLQPPSSEETEIAQADMAIFYDSENNSNDLDGLTIDAMSSEPAQQKNKDGNVKVYGDFEVDGMVFKNITEKTLQQLPPNIRRKIQRQIENQGNGAAGND